MGSCEAWDVVRLPFPYTNRPVHQYRPALVIAINNGIGAPRLLWVLMITSAENKGWPGDVEIADHAGVGLPVASVVRTAKIATVEMDMAERIGRLAMPDRRRVIDAVRDCLSVAGFVMTKGAGPVMDDEGDGDGK
ncbi:type II toxin-antitoxin system PemK/MazF family toxin [Acidithiobacillus thiooxidans]|jgi:mRNA interferase MazF|uniref:type II toxin-antitoxin system PemK/MazF family toxin n=1 Tax=Acidithiobacillus thiooxidans TaxID=930 RepID=UPI001C07BD73|nr:type II toxin-antitoxin system PemK/MazF family toxin [Acidithiobacillus thiooxidans]MBU2840655.1 type II toxin-antitoxin system PemK/MazF family toxin [Acidithiobacillus thiooxidans]